MNFQLNSNVTFNIIDYNFVKTYSLISYHLFTISFLKNYTLLTIIL